MTRSEFLVVVLGLVVGYWMVTNFLSGNKTKTERKDAEIPRGNNIDQEFAKAGGINWAGTLEISASASVDEIRKAYKIQMSKYHPDKVASLGVELKELAERKSTEINIAYKRAMKDRNIGEQFW